MLNLGNSPIRRLAQAATLATVLAVPTLGDGAMPGVPEKEKAAAKGVDPEKAVNKDKWMGTKVGVVDFEVNAINIGNKPIRNFVISYSDAAQTSVEIRRISDLHPLASTHFPFSPKEGTRAQKRINVIFPTEECYLEQLEVIVIQNRDLASSPRMETRRFDDCKGFWDRKTEVKNSKLGSD